MAKYLQLQCKRLFRFLPGALLVALVLMGSLYLALQLFTQQNAGREENQKIAIGLCGETNDPFIEMGLTALSSFDVSRFSLEVREMDEAEAARALAKGKLAAYAVIPDGFMEAAFYGEILPIKFVSTTGATGLISLAKEELSGMISTLLLNSQKGVFGLWDTMDDNDLLDKADGQMDRLSFVYVDYIFSRDRIYSLEVLGIADELGLQEYLLCGLGVLFLMLICLPFAAQMIPGDPALGRMLCAKGKPAWKQALCDFLSYTAVLLCLVTIAILVAKLCFPEIIHAVRLFATLMPVLLLTAAFSYMLYSLSRDMIGGVLLTFFVSVILCFVSGCMYPIYFFPVTAQNIAQWLPTGIARTQLASYITGSASAGILPVLLGYCAVFAGIGILAKTRHIQEVVQ